MAQNQIEKYTIVDKTFLGKGNIIRKFCNIFNSKIGDHNKIGAYTEISGAKIGSHNKIQAKVFIPAGIEIEDDCFIGPGVVFTNDKYPPSHGKKWQKTIIKKGAVIGANATILPGITIGERAVVGAGSVITKDVPSNAIFIGNPGRPLNK